MARRPMSIGCHRSAHRRRGRRSAPRIHDEQPVLVERRLLVEGDAVTCQPGAVAVDQRLLVLAADVGGQRVAEEVADIAHAGQRRGDRPVVEADGAVRAEEEVADVVVTVDERALTLPVEGADVVEPRDVELAELAELGWHLVGELVEGGLHDPGGRHGDLAARSVALRPGRRREPRQVLAPVLRVQHGELVHEPVGDVEDIFVLGAEEATSRCFEILEHHDERSVVGVVGRMPHLGDAHRELGADVGVEAGLGDPHADHADELALFRRERLQLDEECLGDCRVSGDSDPGSTGGAGVGIEDLDRADARVEHLAEPFRRELGDIVGDGHGRFLPYGWGCNPVILDGPAERWSLIGDPLNLEARAGRHSIGGCGERIIVDVDVKTGSTSRY